MQQNPKGTADNYRVIQNSKSNHATAHKKKQEKHELKTINKIKNGDKSKENYKVNYQRRESS